MAFKLLIVTIALAVGVSAKFVWQDDDNSNFPKPRMPTPPTPPSPPTFPSLFPPMFPFPPFPPSALFPQGFGQFNFPDIPLPVVPTPGQIRDVKPGPGEVFHGVAVKSGSTLTQDEHGNWVRKGGTAVVTNDNGKVHEFKHGNAPPNVDEPLKVPTPPKLDFPKFPGFPEMKPLKMPEFKPIKPIDIEKIKTYKPKEGETYFGSSSSSFTNSRTVNGKTVSEGASSVVVNDNGNADEEHVVFKKGDDLKK